jgi:hypothetical protein
MAAFNDWLKIQEGQMVGPMLSGPASLKSELRNHIQHLREFLDRNNLLMNPEAQTIISRMARLAN